jgi:hypothetical protein
LPETVQRHLKNCTYSDLKRMLPLLVPILRADRIGGAAAVLELSEIRTADDFAAAYRALTEDPTVPPSVTTPQTPIQQPYLPKLDRCSELLGVIRNGRTVASSLQKAAFRQWFADKSKENQGENAPWLSAGIVYGRVGGTGQKTPQRIPKSREV